VGFEVETLAEPTHEAAEAGVAVIDLAAAIVGAVDDCWSHSVVGR
jgi:hypothetical protein